MKFDYEKVKELYPDSLSGSDIDSQLNNPDHGSLKFSEISEIFSSMVGKLYQLESLDFRRNLLQKEVSTIESARNNLRSVFNRISVFDIKQNNDEHRTRLMDEARNIYNQEFPEVDNLLFKLQTRQLLSEDANAEFHEIQSQLDQLLKDSKASVSETQKMRERAERILSDLGNSASRVGNLEISKFFEEQALLHLKKADGPDKAWFDGWLNKRRIFFILILSIVVLNLAMYIASLFNADWLGISNFLRPLYSSENAFHYFGMLISLLLICYVGMSFATNNYSVEKQLEIENKNKANIAKTVNLFLAGIHDENMKAIVLHESVKTLFAHPRTGTAKEKVQNINLPVTEFFKQVNKD